MITLLHAVSYAAAIAAFLFVTLSLASGLLWIAEVIEEHGKLSKTVGRRAVYAVIALHGLFLLVDKFPVWPILFGIACHGVYLQNFSKTWPIISLTAPTFLASCGLVLADHFVWFWHFSNKAAEARLNGGGASWGKGRGGPYARPSHAQTMKADGAPTFMDVASFFGICVWFIPLYLFLSLSANDNALPSFGASSPSAPSSTPASSSSSQPRHSIFLALFTRLTSLLPTSLLSRRSRTSSSSSSGLLAPLPAHPRTPAASPLAPQSYSPWGAPEGLPPSSPGGGMFTPGGSPYGSPMGLGVGGGQGGNNGGFQAQMMRRPSGLGMGGLTPPPPPRRANSTPSSPRGDGGAEGLGVGLGQQGTPVLMKRKASNLGLSAMGPAGGGGIGPGQDETAVLTSGRGGAESGVEGGGVGSIGRRRGEKMGGKED